MNNPETVQPEGGEGDGAELTVEQLEAVTGGADFSIVEQSDGTWAIVHRRGEVAMAFETYQLAVAWFRKWIDSTYGY